MFEWLTALNGGQYSVDSVLRRRLPIACSQARPNFRIEDTASQPRSGTTSTLDSAIQASGDILSDAWNVARHNHVRLLMSSGKFPSASAA